MKVRSAGVLQQVGVIREVVFFILEGVSSSGRSSGKATGVLRDPSPGDGLGYEM